MPFAVWYLTDALAVESPPRETLMDAEPVDSSTDWLVVANATVAVGGEEPPEDELPVLEVLLSPEPPQPANARHVASSNRAVA